MPEIRRFVQPSVAFRDPAFDTARSEKFCLVLQIGGEQLTLAVLDNLTNDFLAFEQYVFRKAGSERALAEQLDKLTSEHEWLTGGFKRVDAMVVTERFTLVPAAFFDSTRTAEYLRFNHPVSDTDSVLNDVLRNAEARNVYAFEAKLERSLKKISSSVRLRHHLSPLIERSLSVNKNKPGRRALAHVQQQRFDLVVSDGGNLLLANTFTYQTSEDFIYYLLFACEQLKMNPEKMELEIVGEVETDSAIASLAKKYVRNVSFGQRPVDARFAKGFEQFPAHFHHNLFSLHYFS